MEIKYGDGIEFEVDDQDSEQQHPKEPAAGKLSALEEIIRAGYRAPVRSTANIHLLIGEKRYAIFNLGASGLGIYLNDREEFALHSLLEPMKLIIEQQEFLVKGKVVHLSEDEAHILCGIELFEVQEACKKELAAYLERTRNTLFS